MEKPVHPCVGSDVFETARSKLFGRWSAISADEAKYRPLNGSYTTRGSKVELVTDTPFTPALFQNSLSVLGGRTRSTSLYRTPHSLPVGGSTNYWAQRLPSYPGEKPQRLTLLLPVNGSIQYSRVHRQGKKKRQTCVGMPHVIINTRTTRGKAGLELEVELNHLKKRRWSHMPSLTKYHRMME